MVSEIFESLFWVGPGFVPKPRLVESFSSNRNNQTEEKEIKGTENRSIKSKVIVIVIRHLLGLKQGEKNRNMQIVTQLNHRDNNRYLNKDIVVSLDDK